MENTLAAGGAASTIMPIVIGVGLIVGFFVAWRLMRRYFFNEEESVSSQTWDLDQLRRLHEQGQLSQQEYDHLRQVAKTTLMTDRGGAAGGPDVSQPVRVVQADKPKRPWH